MKQTIELFAGTGSFSRVAAPRGSKTGTQGMGSYKDKSRIPSALFEEIFEQMPENVADSAVQTSTVACALRVE